MKSWNSLQVSEMDLRKFLDFNIPIPVPYGIVPPHGGIKLIGSESGREVLAYFDPKERHARPLTKHNPIKGLYPANKDLHLLYEHLQNDDVLIVIVDGFFGTGKTSTVMAHAIANLKQDSGFRIYLTKPHVPVGRTYGHLPGDLEEKTDPEFESFYQYFERYSQLRLDLLKLEGRVNTAPLEYIRGRDFINAWVIVDEAQNLTKEEAITIASRVADGSKLILIGDSSPWQKDIKKESGLTFLLDLLMGEHIVGHTELKTVEHVLRGTVAKTLLKALTKKGHAL